MILLTRRNGHPVLINCEIIESAESAEAPDEGELTAITLVNGNTIVVREPLDEIRTRVIAFQAAVRAGGKGIA